MYSQLCLTLSIFMTGYLPMTKADGRRQRKAAVLRLRLSKAQTLRTDTLVFPAL